MAFPQGINFRANARALGDFLNPKPKWTNIFSFIAYIPWKNCVNWATPVGNTDLAPIVRRIFSEFDLHRAAKMDGDVCIDRGFGEIGPNSREAESIYVMRNIMFHRYILSLICCFSILLERGVSCHLNVT